MALAQTKEETSFSTAASHTPIDSTMAVKESYLGKRAASNFSKMIKDKSNSLSSETVALNQKFNPESIKVISVDSKEQKQAINHSLIIEKWEGCIKEVRDNFFIAHLYKQGACEAEIIEGEFDINDIPEDERHLVAEGVIFYWGIRKAVTNSGNISNPDYLYIRRMPSWKNFDINKGSSKVDGFFSATQNTESQYTS